MNIRVQLLFHLERYVFGRELELKLVVRSERHYVEVLVGRVTWVWVFDATSVEWILVCS